MDPEILEKIKDPKYYLENFCKIKGKIPGLIPFILNEAQKDLFNTLRKHPRVIILKARQIGFCQHPNTKVLTADLRWLTLDEIEIGQEIVAVDENIPGRKWTERKMRTGVVEKKIEIFAPAFLLKMDDGRELIATEQHRYLSKLRGGSLVGWRTVKKTRVGDVVRYITKPWTEGTFEDGWFGGIIDGEGCLRFKNHSGVEVAVVQRLSPLWEDMQQYAVRNKYSARIDSVDKRKNSDGNTSKFGNNPVGRLEFSRMDEVFRLLGQTRPKRFIGKRFWEGKTLPGRSTGIGWATVVSMESLPPQRMIDLQTSTKTFIANGFVSHNSTAAAGYIYHKTIMNPGTNSALVGYNTDLTSELLDKVKTFWRTTPKNIRPAIKYNSKYEISFPKVDSKIIVLPSTENLGRGYSIHNVLLTELAFWDKAEEKMMAIENSVPINGLIIVESTPNGQGNLYHRMYVADNDYAKKSYGWWWHYTAEEIEIIKRRMNNPMKFAQEYGLEFLSSGRLVFDQEVIKRLRKNIWKIGEAVLETDGKTYFVREEDGLRIYRAPASDGLYVIGVDVAEGVEGGNYSVATVWNRQTGEEVAFYKGLCPPDSFGKMLDKWGRKYNNALMVVEINNHGLTTVTILKQQLYPTLYFRPKIFDQIGMKYTDRLGWRTTKVTRPLLIDDLAQALRENLLVIHSKETLDEMLTFIYDKSNNMVTLEGFNDDCIFSSGIAYQGFKIMTDRPMDQLDYEPHIVHEF